ncbi:MAG: hypothetical protein JWP17_3579 [Solirubrobacterales bacterium]|jgi:hypothetical protein|nr:hypothetical protein [Solirubrobacterales bacterium]
MKLIYKPFGIILGLIAGMAGRKVFDAIWTKIDDEDPPKPTTELASWGKVLSVAAIQGMIFAVVKALVNRAGAKSYEHLTGVWPGEKVPDRER